MYKVGVLLESDGIGSGIMRRKYALVFRRTRHSDLSLQNGCNCSNEWFPTSDTTYKKTHVPSSHENKYPTPGDIAVVKPSGPAGRGIEERSDYSEHAFIVNVAEVMPTKKPNSETRAHLLAWPRVLPAF